MFYLTPLNTDNLTTQITHKQFALYNAIAPIYNANAPIYNANATIYNANAPIYGLVIRGAKRSRITRP